MRYLALIMLVLSLGCSSLKQYDPSVLIDGQPALIMEASQGGQGHISIATDSDGTKVEVVQFGMSEILGGTLKGIIGAAAGVFGGNPEPPRITINVSGQDLNHGEGNTDAENDR